MAEVAEAQSRWMIRLRLKNPSEKDELLGAAEYRAQLGE